MNKMASTSAFGAASEVRNLMEARKRSGTVWQVVFVFATVLVVLFLVLLLSSIIDSVFGYAVIMDEVDPSTLVVGKDKLEDFSRDELIAVATDRLSAGILR